jgi:hypothetical protein
MLAKRKQSMIVFTSGVAPSASFEAILYLRAKRLTTATDVTNINIPELISSDFSFCHIQHQYKKPNV